MGKFRPSWQGFVDNGLYHLASLVVPLVGSIVLNWLGGSDDLTLVLVATLWMGGMILLVLGPRWSSRKVVAMSLSQEEKTEQAIASAVEPVSLTDEQWRDILMKWLSYNRNFTIQRATIDEQSLTVVIARDKTTIQTVKPRGWDQFDVGGSMILSEDHMRALDRSTRDIRRELYEELVIQLCMLGPELVVESEDYHIRRVRYAQPVRAIPGELSEWQLLQAVAMVQRAAGLVAHIITRYARIAESHPSESMSDKEETQPSAEPA
jgi:hypothetical protein